MHFTYQVLMLGNVAIMSWAKRSTVCVCVCVCVCARACVCVLSN
jgi:hypothetical protein